MLMQGAILFLLLCGSIHGEAEQSPPLKSLDAPPKLSSEAAISGAQSENQAASWWHHSELKESNAPTENDIMVEGQKLPHTEPLESTLIQDVASTAANEASDGKDEPLLNQANAALDGADALESWHELLKSGYKDDPMMLDVAEANPDDVRKLQESHDKKADEQDRDKQLAVKEIAKERKSDDDNKDDDDDDDKETEKKKMIKQAVAAALAAKGDKPTPRPKFVQSTTHIDGCPAPKLPTDFLVTDRWWQWVFTKDIKSTDEKTSYGKIRASPFHIPTKINYFDKDDQLVASIQWHFISFVGAHDFLDCKGKKLAESEEKIASKLFGNKHFSQFTLSDAHDRKIAESSKTKFFNHQIILDDPQNERTLIKINKNFMSLSNTWKVHIYTANTKDHLVADPRIITLLAASQEGVPFMGWGSLSLIVFIVSILACCCGCFGCFKFSQSGGCAMLSLKYAEYKSGV